MKVRTLTIATTCLILMAACQQKSAEHSHDSPENDSNQALYDKVMAVHDDVMPKMNDLHKAKTSLQTRLELPGIAESERQVIQQKIAQIDSASESMMAWMRQFQPVSDSAGEDSARAYLEKELAKVEKVRENIHDALKSVE